MNSDCFSFKKIIFKFIAVTIFTANLLAINVYATENINDVEEVSVKKVSSINNISVSIYHPTNGGIVTSGFGERWGRLHKGIDIGKELGKPVVAALNGVVREVFYEEAGYGNIIILDHGNGIETRYAHLDSFEINIGDKVKAGETIGRVGNTGRSTGPHLHFEIRVNGNPVNPQNYLSNN